MASSTLSRAGARPAPVGGHASGLFTTLRGDRWWVGPLLTALGLGAFGLYATWAAFQGEHYYVAPYLSPFYSPALFYNDEGIDTAERALGLGAVGADGLRGHAWFGAWPGWWPDFLPASPALLILVFPGAFRATCYYYRKAYYRSFFLTPPGCAVGPLPQRRYRGETVLLLVQNLHRLALYAALVFIVILGWDALSSYSRGGELGVGVGSVVLTLNALFLAGYTFGCHSWRHLIGGRLDCFTCDGRPSREHGLWKRSSWLNARHMRFAWVSLFWVGFTDLYVRLVSMGVWTDFNTWG